MARFLYSQLIYAVALVLVPWVQADNAPAHCTLDGYVIQANYVYTDCETFNVLQAVYSAVLPSDCNPSRCAADSFGKTDLSFATACLDAIPDASSGFVRHGEFCDSDCLVSTYAEDDILNTCLPTLNEVWAMAVYGPVANSLQVLQCSDSLCQNCETRDLLPFGTCESSADVENSFSKYTAPKEPADFLTGDKEYPTGSAVTGEYPTGSAVTGEYPTGSFVDSSTGRVPGAGNWLGKDFDLFGVVVGDFVTKFTSPQGWGKSTSSLCFGVQYDFSTGLKRISENDIKLNQHTGRFSIEVFQSGRSIQSRYLMLAPSTGDIVDNDVCTDLGSQTSIFDFANNWTISYGIYDASRTPFTGFPPGDQVYVYATEVVSDWMSNMVAQLGRDIPFSAFVLPGSHDAGMNDITQITKLAYDNDFVKFLVEYLGDWVKALGASEIRRLVYNLAFTQKDSIIDQLNLGVRYFDFRPGYCASAFDCNSNIFHQHLFIPGVDYWTFLTSIVRFLGIHPGEIVVVSISFDGFFSDSMKPTLSVLNTFLVNAVSTSGIVVGNKSDLSLTYRQLIAANKRLIWLPIGIGSPVDATKYDSYVSKLYQTTNVQNLVTALDMMTAAKQPLYDYTVLQTQGTAEALIGAYALQLFLFSDCASPIMATKAMFDVVLYPYLNKTIVPRLNSSYLVVHLNDWVDSGMTIYASIMTQVRVAAVDLPKKIGVGHTGDASTGDTFKKAASTGDGAIFDSPTGGDSEPRRKRFVDGADYPCPGNIELLSF